MIVSRNIKNIKLDKDNWALIKDASFKPFESPRSCANTIDSNCIRNLTPEQCVQKCKNSEYCDAGYWINIPKKTDKGSEGSYCLPLSTFFLEGENPSYYVFNKNDIPGAKNLNTYYFVNTNKYPFPDYRVNYIFANDHVLLENVEKNVIVSNMNSNAPAVKLSRNGNTKLELFLDKMQIGDAVVNIKRNNYIFINAIGTSLIMQRLNLLPQSFSNQDSTKGFINRNENKNIKKYYEKDVDKNFYYRNYIKWFAGLSWNMNDWEGGIEIIPVKSTSKSGKLLYTDEFILRYGGGQVIGLEKSGDSYILRLFNMDLNDIKNQKIPHVFRFNPDFSVYYCENDECKRVNISETVVDKNNPERRTYNGFPVTRDGKCFGACHHKYPKGSTIKTVESFEIPSPNSKRLLYNSLWIAGMAILVILIIILVVKFVK